MSLARPKKTLVVPEKDRQETKYSSFYILRESVDPDAEWLIKRGKYCFGYKGFVLADADKGFISKVHVTPANQGESPELPKMMEDVETKRLMTDKTYDFEKNRQFLKSRSIKDGIMYRARKNHRTRSRGVADRSEIFGQAGILLVSISK